MDILNTPTPRMIVMELRRFSSVLSFISEMMACQSHTTPAPENTSKTVLNKCRHLKFIIQHMLCKKLMCPNDTETGFIFEWISKHNYHDSKLIFFYSTCNIDE